MIPYIRDGSARRFNSRAKIREKSEKIRKPLSVCVVNTVIPDVPVQPVKPASLFLSGRMPGFIKRAKTRIA
jgi:hypothetical protein